MVVKNESDLLQYDVIVIGGGLSGLTAGSLLAIVEFLNRQQ